MIAPTEGRPASPLDDVLSSPAFIADPYPTYRVLREAHPLYWSQRWGVWVLSRHADVVRVLRDPDAFSSAGRFNALLEMLPPDEGATLAPIARFGQAAFNVDPPAHTRLRRFLRDAFAGPAIDALRPRVHRLVADLLTRAAAEAAVSPDGTFDLVRALALPLPVAVVCELLGASEEERDGFESWAADILGFLATGTAHASLGRRAADALEAMELRFGDLLEARRRRPRPDLLSQLSRTAHAHGLEPGELALIAAELMIAGHHTTKDLIGNAVITFGRQPAALARVREKPALWPTAVEEVLRYESSIQRGWRRVAAPVTLHGQALRPGELVFLLLAAANRDAAAFDRPDEFDPARDPNRHLAFGYGIHFCVGAPLARLEAPIALAALYERFPRLAPASDTVDWYPSIHIRGPRTLPVRV